MLRNTIFVCVFLCVIFFFLGLIGIQSHTNIVEMDTKDYIAHAAAIHDMGIIRFVGTWLRGEYTEANRQPLYMMLISPVASRSLAGFVAAKKATFAMGFALVILFYICTYRLHGLPIAAIATALLATNASFLSISTMVAVEALLLLFIVLSWFFIIAGFHKRYLWLLAGATTALAYLTKATALLLPYVFIVALIMHYKRSAIKILKDKYFWGFFLVFLIITSPWIVRNIRVYKDPLYNVNKHNMWCNDWQERYRPGFDINQCTLRNYLRNNTPREIVVYLFDGIFKRGPALLCESLKPYPFWQKDADSQLITGAPIKVNCAWPIIIVLLSIVGLYSVRGKIEYFTALVWVISIFLLVSWYSKMMFAVRFMNPLTPFFYVYAALGIVVLAKYIANKIQNPPAKLYARWVPTIIFIAAISWASICLAKNNAWKEIKINKSYSLTKNFSLMAAWLRQNIDDDEPYLIGHKIAEQFFYFQNLAPAKAIDWPQVSSLSELQQFIEENNIRYGVLDVASLMYRSNIFKGYLGFHNSFGMVSLKQIKGFEIVGADPTMPRLFIIVKFKPEEFL